MSSAKETSTAKPSRDSSELNDNSASTLSATSTPEYKILLPPLPDSKLLENSLLLHGDPSARPYRIDDFGPVLKKIISSDQLASLGAFQYNHVWLLAVRSAKEKERLLKLREIQVKGKKCLIVDPSKTALSMKVHWIPISIPDGNVAGAFTAFGKVKSITRDKWRYPGYEQVETTTRIVSIELHEGMTADSLPHQLKILGTSVLVSIPGRAPQCLRCRQIGHIRGQCRSAWCSTCRKFGHESEDCVVTYASRTSASLEASTEHLMDAEETEQTKVFTEVSTISNESQTGNATLAERCKEKPSLSSCETAELVRDDVNDRSSVVPLPHHQPEGNAEKDERTPKTEDTNEKEVLLKRKVDPVQDTLDSSSPRSKSETKKKKKRSKSSPKASVNNQDNILREIEDMKTD